MRARSKIALALLTATAAAVAAVAVLHMSSADSRVSVSAEARCITHLAQRAPGMYALPRNQEAILFHTNELNPTMTRSYTVDFYEPQHLPDGQYSAMPFLLGWATVSSFKDTADAELAADEWAGGGSGMTGHAVRQGTRTIGFAWSNPASDGYVSKRAWVHFRAAPARLQRAVLRCYS